MVEEGDMNNKLFHRGRRKTLYIRKITKSDGSLAQSKNLIVEEGALLLMIGTIY